MGAACLVLTAPGGKIPKDLSWNAAKKMMGNVDQFLTFLKDKFDKDNVPIQCVEKCEKDFLSNPGFTADNIRSKSAAAAGLCGWVINICKYFRIYQVSSQTDPTSGSEESNSNCITNIQELERLFFLSKI